MAEAKAEGANLNAAGGFVSQGSMEWTLRAVGRIQSVEDLSKTVVAIRGGTPVMLGEVADVREAPAIRRGIAHRLRGEVVSCRVTKQFGSDTVKVATGLRQAFEGIQKALPSGVQLRIVYDQSQLVSSALGGVTRAILIGAFLVVVILLVLVGDWRAALIVTLTLPLSILLAGLFLKPANVGINTMTLGGLAIAVGILVDAAIIMTENIVHRITLKRNEGDRKVHALAAAIEVGRPIAFATLIVIAVFFPLFTMTGIEGRMYSPLAAAVISAIAAALVLALTLVPVLSGNVLRPRPEGRDEDVWLVRRLKTIYAPALDKVVHRSGWTMLASLAITVPALALAFYVGTDFMPKLDEGAFLIQTILPPEASLAEVDRVNHRVEDTLRQFPEVEDVVRRTGRAERTEDPMPHTLSDVLVVLKPERTRSLEELEASMREQISHVPGATALFTTPLGMRIDEGLGARRRHFGPSFWPRPKQAGGTRRASEKGDEWSERRHRPASREANRSSAAANQY
jgi:heavy metal efflux system protein